MDLFRAGALDDKVAAIRARCPALASCAPLPRNAHLYALSRGHAAPLRRARRRADRRRRPRHQPDRRAGDDDGDRGRGGAGAARGARCIAAGGDDGGARRARSPPTSASGGRSTTSLLRWSHFMGRFFAMRGAVGTRAARARVRAGRHPARAVDPAAGLEPGGDAAGGAAPTPRCARVGAAAVARDGAAAMRRPPPAPRVRARRAPACAGAAAPSRWILSPLSDLIWFQGSVLAGVALLVFFVLAPPLRRRADRDAAGAAGAVAVGDPVRRHARRRHLRAQLPRARRRASAPACPAPGRWRCSRSGRLAAVADWAAGGVVFPYFLQAALLWAYYHLVRQHWGFVALYRRPRAGRSDAGAARRGAALARLPLSVRALLAHARVRDLGSAAAAAAGGDGAVVRHVLDGAVALAAVALAVAWIRRGGARALGPKHLFMAIVIVVPPRHLRAAREPARDHRDADDLPQPAVPPHRLAVRGRQGAPPARRSRPVSRRRPGAGRGLVRAARARRRTSPVPGCSATCCSASAGASPSITTWSTRASGACAARPRSPGRSTAARPGRATPSKILAEDHADLAGAPGRARAIPARDFPAGETVDADVAVVGRRADRSVGRLSPGGGAAGRARGAARGRRPGRRARAGATPACSGRASARACPRWRRASAATARRRSTARRWRRSATSRRCARAKRSRAISR